MGLFNFFSGKNRCLGIDVGTGGVKIVELEKEENKYKLINYGLTQAKPGENWRLLDLNAGEVGLVIKKILKEMGTGNKKTVVSLPVALSFATLVETKALPESEMANAIAFEAKKYVPVPIDDVIFDWAIVDQAVSLPQDQMIKPKNGPEEKRVLVLLVAVPKDVIAKYKEIAKNANLELLSLEIESFSLARALIANDPKAYVLLDLGTRGSNIIVVEKGLVRISFSVESPDRETLLTELERIVNLYKTKYNKNIERCILSGGSIYTPAGESLGLEEELAPLIKKRVGLEASFGNPLSRIIYPEKLKDGLEVIAPSLATAIGLAIKGLS